MPTINIEIKTAVRAKSKKDIKRIRDLVQAYCIALTEDFPDCKGMKLFIYDNKESINKMIAETVLN